MAIKAIETVYNGYRFRSRLEARWAVFFDACGVRWEYEPEGYDLGNGLYYLPDFLLHDVTFNHMNYSSGRNCYVEVKGTLTAMDKKKIAALYNSGTLLHGKPLCESLPYRNAQIVTWEDTPIAHIKWERDVCANCPYSKPDNDNDYRLFECLQYDSITPIFVVGDIPDPFSHLWQVIPSDEWHFNFGLIDGDNFNFLPGIAKDGSFHLFGADSSYTYKADEQRTSLAYTIARQARFEHGETPTPESIRAMMKGATTC